MSDSPIAGINGFGRFGLGLFRAWFDDPAPKYAIGFINDDSLTGDTIRQILKHDAVVTAFNDLDVVCVDGHLQIRRDDGRELRVGISSGPIEQCGWLREVGLVFDCSSRASNFERYTQLLGERTRAVLIGATTHVADATLVMGYNHAAYLKGRDRIISFGSCTVIPGVHLIAMIEALFGLENVLINIVHSVPRWRLESGQSTALGRKVCSLERVAPMVVPTLAGGDIKVNYTFAPFHGVSLMDFAFHLTRPFSREDVLEQMHAFVRQKGLDTLIGFVAEDEGAAAFLNSEKSITLIESSFDVRGRRLFFFGYFNNEGSGIRLHELASFIVSTWH